MRAKRGSQRCKSNSPDLHVASFKSSPKEQHFIRSSALASSGRRSSRRRRSTRTRQVRFQPIPQSINISTSNNQEGSCASSISNLRGGSKSRVITNRGAITYKAYQASKKSLAHLSAKPLARKLNRLKSFNKITLKSFNHFAHQIHQSLSTPLNYTPSKNHVIERTRNSSGLLPSPHGNLQCNEFSQTCHQLAQDSSTQHYRDRDEHDHSLDDEDDYCDWGSDFDEQSCSGSSNLSQSAISSSAYLLEIGRVNCDARAIEDVIQDRGMSGHFKQLDDFSAQQPNVSSQLSLDELESGQRVTRCFSDSDNVNQMSTSYEDEEDEEAELKSLEARQGFRKIRDKLEIILDQKLANYKASTTMISSTSKPELLSESIDTCPPKVAELGERSVTARKDLTQGEQHRRLDIAETGLRVDRLPISGCDSSEHEQLDTELVSLQSNRCPETRPRDYGDQCSSSNKLKKSKIATKQAQADLRTEFDCQSHCSDESSGLESNHSGSQDSGHSTQHSGYSTSAGNRPSPTTPLGQQLPVPPSSNVRTYEQSDGCPSIRSESGCSEDRRRRERFLQNRRIINNKLELMFKSRHLETATSATPIATHSLAEEVAQTNTSSEVTVQDSFHQSEVHIRRILLEQQRQMSLKLKQKPRRKSVKRLYGSDLNQLGHTLVTASTSSALNLGLDKSNAEKSGWMLKEQAHRHHLISQQESLTKRLSMICLRQFDDQTSSLSAHGNDSLPHCRDALSSSSSSSAMVVLQSSASSAILTNQEASTRPVTICGALSLRQLVKEVIDSCENSDSILPQCNLERSDSSSSDFVRANSELM